MVCTTPESSPDGDADIFHRVGKVIYESMLSTTHLTRAAPRQDLLVDFENFPPGLDRQAHSLPFPHC
jgi:hypothetical protein